MKDPAFLFYTGDFHTGTLFFTDEQVGKYIRLLMAQHQHGRLTEKQVLHICKTHDKDILSKFTIDENGSYFNERLEFEINKRKAYSESRRKNRSGDNKKEENISLTYDIHMENENRNKNKDINKDKDKKPKKKKPEFVPPKIEEVKSFFVEKGYTEKSAQSFFDYYSAGDWVDGQGTKVKNWKQKAIAVWFKPENENKANQIDIKTHAPVWKFELGEEVTELKDGSKITANDYYGNEMQWIDKVVNWRKCR